MRRVRLKGGRLAHYADGSEDTSVRLAHDDWAWSDRLVPAADTDPDCPRCVARLERIEALEAAQREAEAAG